MDEILKRANDEQASGAEDMAISAPHGERDRWLDCMADMQLESDRRYESLVRRQLRIERKLATGMPEEMKAFFLMLALYIGVQLLLPLVMEAIGEWRKPRR